MPIIKPISDLRNKTHEISTLVHETNEPVFITKNGEGDMVVMSLAQYGNIQMKLDLYSKLAVAQARLAEGKEGRPLSKVMKDLRKRIRDFKKIHPPTPNCRARHSGYYSLHRFGGGRIYSGFWSGLP